MDNREFEEKSIVLKRIKERIARDSDGTFEGDLKALRLTEEESRDLKEELDRKGIEPIDIGFG